MELKLKAKNHDIFVSFEEDEEVKIVKPEESLIIRPNTVRPSDEENFTIRKVMHVPDNITDVFEGDFICFNPLHKQSFSHDGSKYIMLKYIDIIYILTKK